jgi:hypothetical protein
MRCTGQAGERDVMLHKQKNRRTTVSWATHISMTTPDSNERSATSKKLAFADRSAAFCYHLNSLLNLASINTSDSFNGEEP